MAAFKDKSAPDLECFAGSSWASWEKAVEKEGLNKKEQSPNSFNSSGEVARLKRQDFGLFGFCPGKDEFYIVVCEHCRLPFKPQAFRYHIERHHKQNILRPPPEAKQKRPKKLSSVVPGLSKTHHLTNDKTFKVSTNSMFNSSLKSSISNGPKRKPEKTSNSTKQSVVKASSEVVSKNSPNPSLKHSRNKTPPLRQLLLSPGSNSSSNSSGSSSKHNFPVPSLPITKHQSRHETDAQRLHKHSANLSTKPHSKKVEKTDKYAHLNKSSDRLHVSSKSAKRKSSERTLEISAKKEYILLDGESVDSHLISNGPVVMLEKSPYIGNVAMFNNNSPRENSTSSTPSPQRYRKHHHNPQVDVVKASDRNLPSSNPEKLKIVKPEGVKKKILPLKPREYDPNKHCGVWVEDEQLRCTRSLTCKSHSRSSKRKVPGRRKAFDELVRDQANAKLKLKEKAALISGKHKPSSSNLTLSGEKRKSPQTPTPSNKIDQRVMSPPLAPAKLGQKPRSSESKSKHNISLFPRNVQARYVDCGEDEPETSLDSNFNPQLEYLNHNPKPIAVCDFGSLHMDQRHSIYNRHSNHTWRRFTKSFSVEKVSHKLQKNKHFPITSSVATSFSGFASMPSASPIVMDSRTRVLSVNDDLYNATTPNFFTSYANKKPATELRGRCHSHNLVTTPSSIKSELLSTRRNSLTVPNKAFRTNENGVVAQKYAAFHMATSNHVDESCKFVQISAPQSNISATSTSLSTTIDLNSLLLKGRDQVIQLGSDQTHFISPPSGSKEQSSMFKHPNDALNSASLNLFSGHAPKLKKNLKPKKNSANHVLTQSVVGKHLTNHVKQSLLRNHTAQQQINKNLQRVHSAPVMQSKDTNKSLVRTKSTEGSQASISHKPIKRDTINGLSSSILSTNSWPQSVTLSGGIGALRPTHNQEQTEGFINFNSKGSNKQQQISQNLNTNNNNNNIRNIPEPSNNTVTMDTLQSLLIMDNNATSSDPINLNETSVKLGSGEKVLAPSDAGEYCGELDYLSLPQELLSLLDSGQGTVQAASSSQDLIRDDSIIFNSDSAVELFNS